MKTPSQEDLLGYVLGALDAQEQRDIQQSLDNHPELEDQLLEIKNSLLPLDHLDTSGCRPGMARRACELVANISQDPELAEFKAAEDGSRSFAPRLEDEKFVGLSDSSAQRHLMRPSTWSLPDFMVAVAAMAILAGILFPTLNYARFHGRVLACQNNLQELGSRFLRFSETNHGSFPEIPRSGPLAASGIYASMLKESGFVDNDQIFSCAGVSANSPPVHIPTLEVIQSATGQQLFHLQRTAGGHFGYSMGYQDVDGYCPPKNLGRTNVVLLADMPSLNLVGRRSANHCGRGQNCLFEDGHVVFIRGDSYGEDAIFVNDYNLVAPGCRPGDNVIAPSHLGPITNF